MPSIQWIESRDWHMTLSISMELHWNVDDCLYSFFFFFFFADFCFAHWVTSCPYSMKMISSLVCVIQFWIIFLCSCCWSMTGSRCAYLIVFLFDIFPILLYLLGSSLNYSITHNSFRLFKQFYFCFWWGSPKWTTSARLNSQLKFNPFPWYLKRHEHDKFIISHRLLYYIW